MIPHDYHVHTRFSTDSKAPMQDVCAAAAASGLPEIGITDHYDLHPDESPRDWLDLENWVACLEECRTRHNGQLTVRAGIEIGEPHRFIPEVRRMMTRYPFDFVLGSLHWVGRESVFMPGFFQRPAAEAFGAYFEELARMTRAGEFDILGHLDVPVRTAFDIYNGYDPRPLEAMIRPVLRTCIDRGIAVEINSGTLRRGAAILTPGLPILKWYAEMGGELLTLGSDAHRAQDVGAGLEVAQQAARAAGLRYFTTFEGRRARQTALP